MAVALGYGQTFDVAFTAPVSSAVVTLSVHAPKERMPPHSHASDFVCIVLDGGFSQETAAERRGVGQGDIVFQRGNDWHANRIGERGALCLNVHASGPLIEPLQVAERCTGQARALARQLAAELVIPEGDALQREALLAELLMVLARRDARDEEAWITLVLDALDGDPRRVWSLDELALLAGRHPTHLARRFRARTGLSIGAYRRRRRLTELCVQLHRGNAALSALAAEYGYADQAHMCREFKAFAGATPAAYRRAAR